MINIAHRGALTEAPENSLEAFKIAHQCGATRLELDVHPSLSSTPYVIHDETLDRTTNGSGAIREKSDTELQSLQLTNQESIPTLEQVIDKFAPIMEINIEIKGSEFPFIEKICKLCDPYLDKIIISSEFTETLNAVHKINSSIARACLLPAREAKESDPDIPFQQAMEQTQCHIVHPEVQFVTSEFMEHCRKNNWKVFTWISLSDEQPNKIPTWEKIRSFQIDGHCTNFPREFQKWYTSCTN